VSGATLNRPELRIYPRRDLAVRLGVSTESLSETIRVATIGDVGPALAKFDAGDRTIPIRVLLEENARADGKFSNRYASRLNAEAACRSSPSPT
jgi:Cation/multidrug efflux pump